MRDIEGYVNPIELADEIALRSQDKSRRAGCYIKDANGDLVVIGYNRLSKGIDVDDNRNHERPIKYKLFIHAELNAITTAAKLGIKLHETTMYLNWFPCSNCALAIVNSGISELHCDKQPDWNSDDRWIEDQLIALDILIKGDVEVICDNYEVKNRDVNEN